MPQTGESCLLKSSTSSNKWFTTPVEIKWGGKLERETHSTPNQQQSLDQLQLSGVATHKVSLLWATQSKAENVQQDCIYLIIYSSIAGSWPNRVAPDICFMKWATQNLHKNLKPTSRKNELHVRLCESNINQNRYYLSWLVASPTWTQLAIGIQWACDGKT